MSPTTKKYIITTRTINSKEGGFLNSTNCVLAEWDAQSPMLDFYVDDAEIADWIYSIYVDTEDMYSQELKSEIRKQMNFTYDPLDDLEGFMEELCEKATEKKEQILHRYREELYAFIRKQLAQTVEGVKQTSYFTIRCDNKIIIALPHLAEMTNKSHADNKKWIDALINSFASANDEIYLILHDKDLYGYSGITYKLLKPDSVERLCGRNDVRILVFQHSGNKLNKCLCMNDPKEAISKIETLIQEGIKGQKYSEAIKNF